MKTEPHYGAEYHVVPFGDKLIKQLAEAKPEPGETLGFCPDNVYIPDWPLTANRLENTGVPSIPKEIRPNVWFKQDD